MIRDAFLDSAEAAAMLLREPVLADRWSAPSALADFTTGGLARHLANQITASVTYLAAAPGASAIPVLEHFTGNTWVTSGVDSADNIGIRRRGEHAATLTTAAGLADDVDAALAELRKTVPAEPAERIIDLGDWGTADRRFPADPGAGTGCARRRSGGQPEPADTAAAGHGDRGDNPAARPPRGLAARSAAGGTRTGPPGTGAGFNRRALKERA
jgi:hypothetical protein